MMVECVETGTFPIRFELWLALQLERLALWLTKQAGTGWSFHQCRCDNVCSCWEAGYERE